MKQAEFERAVSRATGESRDTIRRMGFSLMVVPDWLQVATHDRLKACPPAKKAPNQRPALAYA